MTAYLTQPFWSELDSAPGASPTSELRSTSSGTSATIPSSGLRIREPAAAPRCKRCGLPQSPAPGKLRLESLIAEGGMGAVYRAQHVLLKRSVAVKMVKPEHVDNEEVLSRFMTEARTLAALSGPGFVRVLDCDYSPDGLPFIAMELLEGQDVRAYLESQGRVELTEALTVLLGAARAMAEAHEKGFVHRDLKPDNLFLANAGSSYEVKVLDFGIVKTAAAHRVFTLSGSGLGSPHYMAPEQLEDPHCVDARADIWSLGVVLYELLTGTVPFCGNTLVSITTSILYGKPKDLSELAPRVPRDVIAVVERCLYKAREGRYAQASELAADLARCLEYRPTSSEQSAHRPTGCFARWANALKHSHRR